MSSMDLDREVTTKEKVHALMQKDLQIRVYRDFKMYIINFILVVGVCWTIPFVYFCADKWSWEVGNKETPSSRPYNWMERIQSPDHVGVIEYGYDPSINVGVQYSLIQIEVDSAVWDTVVPRLQECAYKNRWWGTRFGFELRNSDTDEVRSSHQYLNGGNYTAPAGQTGDEDEDEDEAPTTVWGINGAGRLINNWGTIPWKSWLVFGISRNYIKEWNRLTADAQFISGCQEGNDNFFDPTLEYVFTDPDGVSAPVKSTDPNVVVEAIYDRYPLHSSSQYLCSDNNGRHLPCSDKCIASHRLHCEWWEAYKANSLVYNYQSIKWNTEHYTRNEVSALFTMIPGFIWIFTMFFVTIAFFLHVVHERNSGIKTIMMSMGLENETYMISQFLSYCAEVMPLAVFSSFLMCAMVADAGDDAGAGLYTFFAWVMSFVNMAPFLMTLATFIDTEKNASALSTIMKYVIPLLPTMVVITYLNDEPGIIRFLSCMLPPINFIFCVRDSLLQNIHFEPLFCLFWNFFFWSFTAWYFDLTMDSASGASERDHCFCCKNLKEMLFGPGNANVQSTELGAARESVLKETPMLYVRDLVKEFGSFRAVDGVKYTIMKNTIYGLLGFNGAGKTTTLNMITGILRPTSGVIKINGVDISQNMNAVRAYIGTCPQHNVLFDLLSVEQHMYLFGRLKGMTDAQVDAQMEGLLVAMHMEHQRKTDAQDLSGGQKRMLCMIQAFLGDPKLVLLDEPTSGVDAESRRAMWDYIIESKKDRVIILTTHQMREADVLCDEIGIMSAGQLLVEDTPVELKNKYATGFTFYAKDADKNEIQKALQEYPEVEIEQDGDSVEIKVNTKANKAEIPKIVRLIEGCDSVDAKTINVQAATLENVFLRLAKNVERGGRASVLSGSSLNIDTTASEDRPGFSRTATSARLDGLNTDGDNYSRPCCCTQLFYLMCKRFYLTLIYWAPMVSGVAQTITLAVVVLFILTLFGLNLPSLTARLGDYETWYVVRDIDNPGPQWTARWQNVPKTTLVSYDTYKSDMGYFTRSEVSDPKMVVVEPEGTVYMENFYYAYALCAANYRGGAEGIIDLTGRGQGDITNYMVMPLLVLGLGLIVASTWHHVGTEVKSQLYEYQIQNGVNPFLLWISHWIFDIFVNTALVAIFIAITLSGESKGKLRDFAIYGSLLAFMPYIVFQYLVVWAFNNDKTIENILTWSMLVGVGLFVLEMVIITKGFTDTDDIFLLFGPETDMWAKDNLKFWLIVHYALPPIQFMHAMYQSLDLYYKDLDSKPEYGKNKDNYYARIWKSFVATLCWSFVFFFCQWWAASRPDPQKKEVSQEANAENVEIDNVEKLNDVETERMRVKRFVDRMYAPPASAYQEEEIKNADDGEKVEEGDVEDAKKAESAGLSEFNEERKDEDFTVLNDMRDVEEELEELPMIISDEITKVFVKGGGPFTAVDAISFAVNKGECFGLLGKNGAGKSTTMNMLTTVLSPTTGQAWLGGRSNTLDKQQIIGYCPQKDLIWTKMTVWQHLLFFGLLKGVPMSDIQDQITRLCVALTLDPFYHRATGKLSGGNKRKVMLATALIGSVEVVFLDEPSTGVDPFSRKCMADVIQRYAKERAVILTTHMMEEVDMLCDRAGIMVNGKFRCLDTIHGLLSKTNTGYQMEVSLTQLKSEEQVDEVEKFVHSNLPGSVLTEKDTLVMAFQVPSAQNNLSDIFELANTLQNEYRCDTLISQMTMDQLFLKLTHDQTAEDMDAARFDGEFEKKGCCFGMCPCEVPCCPC